MEAGGIFQEIPHHSRFPRHRKTAQLLVHRPVGVDAIVIVGVDDAAGLTDRLRRAQQGVDGTEGLGPLRRQRVKRRQGGEILKGVGHLHGTAVPGGPLLQIISAQAAHQCLHLRLDNEHHLAETRPQGVIDGVLHQNLPVGADAVHLLTAAVAGSQARRHNDQSRLHNILRAQAAGSGPFSYLITVLYPILSRFSTTLDFFV